MPGSHSNDRTRHGFYNAGVSEPRPTPGSDAWQIPYGMDRALALAETGLDSAFPLPGRTAERYGERSGIYLSVYGYPSSGRDSTFTSKHYVMVAARREARDPVGSRAGFATRRWTCPPTGASSPGPGQSRPGATVLIAARFTRALSQPIEDDNLGARTFAGKWAGFGKDGEMNTGPWSLTLVEQHLGEQAVERWNREPE